MNATDYKGLVTVVRQAATGNASTNFSASQCNEAAIAKIKEFYGIEDGMTARQIRTKSKDVFAVIEEVIDEILPAKIESKLSQFAEVRSMNRGDEMVFKIPTTNASKRRMLSAIKNGVSGGVYQARRLDGRNFSIETVTETVGFNITLEEILLGTRTIAEAAQIVADGFVERTYINVIKSLRALINTVPASNKASVAAADVDKGALDSLIRISAAYGTPHIIGFSQLLDKLDNATASGIFPESDLEDIKRSGRVGTYKGRTIIELPNYLTDATNSEWYFKEKDLFIIPADAKPVKIALEGEAYTSEITNPGGSKEVHFHKNLGTAVLADNNICIYSHTSITDGLY